MTRVEYNHYSPQKINLKLIQIMALASSGYNFHSTVLGQHKFQYTDNIAITYNAVAQEPIHSPHNDDILHHIKCRPTSKRNWMGD
jgi:hypothetical protein